MKSILISLLLGFPLLNNAQLLMQITNPQVSGNQLTYEMIVDGFVDVMGFQYGISYDTAVLDFSGVRNIAVPGMEEGDFYEFMEGLIANQWFDLNFEGVSLPDGSVMYELLFDILKDTTGSVCFFVADTLPFEVIDPNDELLDVLVTDDCHEEPFLIVGEPSSTTVAALQYGLSVVSPVTSSQLVFSLKESRELEFRVYDMNGRQAAHFPKAGYGPGEHSLLLKNKMSPGIYFLSTEIGHQPVVVKVVCLQP